MDMKKMEELLTMYESNIGLASQWLEGRGLTVENVAPYRLGVVVDDSPESRPYKRRLAIPYLTPSGVVDIRYRALDDRGPKYLSRPGAEGHLYNVGALWRDSDVIAICEGELDALVMDTFSGIPAVGIPGVNLWKKHYGLLFNDYERIIILGDGDDAGREFAATLAEKVPNSIPVAVGRGMDVNDLFQSQGVPGLRHLLAA